MTDALGNELVIGARYGYSTSVSGRSAVVVGTLKSIGVKKVTLDVERRTEYFYGTPSKHDHSFAPMASITSLHLFPVA
jgi:hypothetical protein